jgi:DNA-binding LytR/AlgR family response regulator
MEMMVPEKKRRVILKKGINHVAVNLEDVVCFYYESKVVFALTREGYKFISPESLTDLEGYLDQHMFFRVNRQSIINGRFIKSFRVYNQVKIRVELEVPSREYHVEVSQKRVARFRKWVYGI